MLKNTLLKIINFFKSGSDRSVIAICFLVSTLFWFLIKFSKEYTYYVDYPVSFVNQPIDKYLKEVPISELQIKVKGFGFNFLKQNFSNKQLSVDVSKLQNYKSTYYWLSQTEQASIAQKLNGFSILEIEPDTVFLNFSNKTRKTVEVKVPKELSFKENYVQYGSFKMEPEVIEVYGPSHILDTLSYIYTSPLVMENIIEDIDAIVSVNLPHQLLSSKTKELKVSQEVARFTQMTKTISIQVKNVPKGKELRIKPDKVELSYWIAMDDVGKVKENDFEVYCDYNEVLMTDKALLNVFINQEKVPSVARRVKHYPVTVEFIRLN